MQADGARRFYGEAVILDTAARRVIRRGIKAIPQPEGDSFAVYLRLGPLGWIRLDHWGLAMWIADELNDAVQTTLDLLRLRADRQRRS